MGGATLDYRTLLTDFSCAFSFAFGKTEFTGCEEFCSLGGATLDCCTPHTYYSCAFSFAFGKTEFTDCEEEYFFCGRNTPLTDVCRYEFQYAFSFGFLQN